EQRHAVAVADRVEPLRRALHVDPFVDLEVLAGEVAQADGLEADVAGAWLPPHGDEDLVAGKSPSVLERRDDRPVASVTAHLRDLGAGDDRDALLLERLLHLLAGEGLLPSEETRASLEDGDLLGAEAVEALGELHPDRAAAEDKEPPRHLLRRRRGDVGPRPSVGESVDRR